MFKKRLLLLLLLLLLLVRIVIIICIMTTNIAVIMFKFDSQIELMFWNFLLWSR